ncbi:transcriptional regulator, HxlR family [Thermosinus carboxydivorans Nor1]|uniref:Transcriptional regulator, HxlR family n=1 Tax=Thermosinus carboxydivorans Nor1 TaxID=401526 RepID=A1HRN2_9FIRM|nr:helix-turn-helix domain-containing protein [Thermosinus carboxydivorans]EAX47356.1 transcriptional regulator, HxlR family [Thermosinus carboxydivorans Nor1]
MSNCEANDTNCPVTYTLSVLGRKWKWLIIYTLSEEGTLRYGELKKSLPGITHKMLSKQLKELESEQLIYRKEYHQIPPKVEYSLTPKGKTLIPILNLMCDWGAANWPFKANNDSLDSLQKG